MAEFIPIGFRALGLMSGTSLDGVDAAVLVTDGIEIQEFGESAFRPYSKTETACLAAAQGSWPQGDREILHAALKVVQSAHIEVINRFRNIDLLGFHGQTVNHDPLSGRTFQIGDGEDIAKRTGIPTIWDFRTTDMGMGGQGAPLAPYFHFACAKWASLSKPSAFLNLGGVGNVTLIDPLKPTPESEGALLAFDTGPANALINDLMQSRQNVAFDNNGALAAQGTVDEAILGAILERPFFAQKPPKSLDRHDFHDVLGLCEHLSNADAAATLTAVPAACVAANQIHLPLQPQNWYICGGGAQNPTMMQQLQSRVSGSVYPIETLDLDGDMLEAHAFAYLAVRSMRSLPISGPTTTGCRAPATGGRLAEPQTSSI